MKWKRPELPAQWRRIWERYRYVLLVILAGVVLLLLPEGGETAPEQNANAVHTGEFDVEEMERKLEHALSRISGAGEVTVVLTLTEGSRRILAQDTQISQKEQMRSTVIVSQGSGMEQPIVLQRVFPVYQGALVVCDGGADPKVKLQVLSAVQVLTGLGSDKISICKRQ